MSSALTEGGLQPRQSVSLIVVPSTLSLENAQKMHPENFGHLKNPHMKISNFTRIRIPLYVERWTLTNLNLIDWILNWDVMLIFRTLTP